MRKSLTILIIVVLGLGAAFFSVQSKNIVAPQVSAETAPSATKQVARTTPSIKQKPEEQAPVSFVPQNLDAPPAELIIPSIQLDAPIQKVGTNTKGEMDVPNGRTNNVGWYEFGTIPGKRGSAVLDAHVFAAFSNLNKVKAGDDIYVVNAAGTKLHFVVSGAMTYALNDVPLNLLFNQNDGAHLHLITCAGQLTPDRSTYDHRLVVYADLVE